jgi:hypothetical protein
MTTTDPKGQPETARIDLVRGEDLRWRIQINGQPYRPYPPELGAGGEFSTMSFTTASDEVRALVDRYQKPADVWWRNESGNTGSLRRFTPAEPEPECTHVGPEVRLTRDDDRFECSECGEPLTDDQVVALLDRESIPIPTRIVEVKLFVTGEVFLQVTEGELSGLRKLAAVANRVSPLAMSIRDADRNDITKAK